MDDVQWHPVGLVDVDDRGYSSCTRFKSGATVLTSSMATERSPWGAALTAAMATRAKRAKRVRLNIFIVC